MPPTEPTPKDPSDLAPTTLEGLAEDISRLSTHKSTSPNAIQDGIYETPIDVEDGKIQIVSLILDESVDLPEYAGVDIPKKGTTFVYSLQAQLDTTSEPIEGLMVTQTDTYLSLDILMGASMHTVDISALSAPERQAIQNAVILSFYTRFGIKEILANLD